MRGDQLLPRPRLARLAWVLSGLALFGGSLALLVKADLGLPAWDVFHQGLAEMFDVPLGAVVIAVSGLVLLLWIPLKERPGLGTILNAVLVGLTLEASLVVLPEPSSFLVRSLLVVGGVALNGVATAMYLSAGLGAGPRDGLMTGLAARGWSIAWVRFGIEVSVLGVGWLLGGTVGVGTLMFALAIGPLIAVCLKFFHRKLPVLSEPGGAS